MNIFIILIMGVMLATYQYFTTKRSTDVVLNKDELKLQAELTCMKQYHEFASAHNEEYTVAKNLKGTGVGQVNYTCQGSENIDVQKYCIDASGSITGNCENAKEHCVSTTKWKTFTKQETYLKTQILKTGISIVKNNKIKGKAVKIPTGKETSDNSSTQELIGLISCVDAEKIKAQNKMEKTNCKEGEYPVLEAGIIKCKKLTEISPCTTHEKETSSSNLPDCSLITTNTQCKTSITSGKYCIPDTNKQQQIECLQTNQNKIWNKSLRLWVCSDGKNECPTIADMIIKDDKNKTLTNKKNGTIKISNPFNPQYNKTTSSYICTPKADLFVSECQKLVDENYGYLAVENIGKNTTTKEGGTTTSTSSPICRLSAKENSNAIENCTPCETAVFDTLNAKWKCKGYSWNELKQNNGKLIDQLKGAGSDRTNTKGIKGCFSGCSQEQINLMKTGIRNQMFWGLSYNSNSRMWTCFSCQNANTYNNQCNCSNKDEQGKCKKGDYGTATCKNDTVGKCTPFDCSLEYQVLINGECYTKWCNKHILPDNVEIPEKRTENSCPNTSPWMVYNAIKDCVYCIRPPTERLE